MSSGARPRSERRTAAEVTAERRAMARGAAWSMIAVAALGLTRLLYSAIIGHTGDPARLGAVSSAISLSLIASLATSAATGAAATKHIAAERAAGRGETARSLHGDLLIWTIAGSIIVCGILLLAHSRLLPGSTTADAVATAALAATYSGYTFQKAVLYGYQQVRRYAVLEVVTDIAALVLVAVAVLVIKGLFLWPLVAAYATFLLCSARATPRPIRGRRWLSLPLDVRKFVAWAAIGMLASQGFLQLSLLVVQQRSTTAEAGFFAAALTLVAPLYFVPRALSLALFPQLSASVGRLDSAAVARQTDMLSKLLFVGLLPVFAATAGLAWPLLHLVFGAAFTPATPAFMMLVAATYVSVVPVPAVNALSASKISLARVPPLASLAGLVVGCVCWSIFDGTASDVAVGYLVGSIVQAAVPVTIAFRTLSVNWGRLWMRLALAWVACAAAGGVAWLQASPTTWILAGFGCLLALGLLLGRTMFELLAGLRGLVGVRT